MHTYVRIMYAWMLSGFITHVGLVYTLSSLETVMMVVDMYRVINLSLVLCGQK